MRDEHQIYQVICYNADISCHLWSLTSIDCISSQFQTYVSNTAPCHGFYAIFDVFVPAGVYKFSFLMDHQYFPADFPEINYWVQPLCKESQDCIFDQAMVNWISLTKCSVWIFFVVNTKYSVKLCKLNLSFLFPRGIQAYSLQPLRLKYNFESYQYFAGARL